MRDKMGCPSGGCATEKPVLKYNITKRNITPSNQGQIPIGNRVNGITVKNNGTTLVIFNREPLLPGESQTIGGNEGEEYVGDLQIYFQLPTPPPVTVINSAWVTIKYYVTI